MKKLVIVACIIVWLVAAVLAAAILTREDPRDDVTFQKRVELVSDAPACV